MLSIRPEEIVYRHELDHPPTEYEMSSGLGRMEFLNVLKLVGWSDEENRATMPFHVLQSRYAEPGNNYIEWRATRIE